MLFWTIIGTFIAGLISFGVFIYYLKKGQFKDVEDTKYQIFRDE